MIEIIEVKTYRQKRAFINFPLQLYKNNPYFVPCFYQDEMAVLNHKSPYENVTESVFFLTMDGKKVVGRIQGLLQKQYNEIYNTKRVRFTRFDSIDDKEVSRKLFQAVEDWAKSKGMDTLCGPLGFSDFEREGLLIEGFDQEQTFEEQYNYDYYQALVEDFGFEKEADWVESQIKFPKEMDPRYEKLADRLLKKWKIHVIDAPSYSKKEFLAKYGDGFFDCITDAYEDLYGTVPFTPETRKAVIKSFLPIIDLHEVFFLADENEKIVAIGLTFPGISKAVQKSKGHMYPLSILRILRAIKDPTTIDLGLIAVRKEYKNSSITAYFVSAVHKAFSRYKRLDHVETNLNLEDNLAIRNMWTRFDSKENKRRRSFVKTIA